MKTITLKRIVITLIAAWTLLLVYDVYLILESRNIVVNF